MNILIIILQLAIIIGLPLVINKFRNKQPVKLIGTVGTAYVVGIIIALIVFGIRKAGVDFRLNSDIGEIGSYAAIGVAIPLLLFNTDFNSLKRLSRNALCSFGLLMVSVLCVSVCFYFIFKSVINDCSTLAGMATGLYTGGTPNLNAIGSMFGLDREIIAVSNLSDMMIGGVFYVFLLTLCKPLLKKFLKAEKPTEYMKNGDEIKNIDDLNEEGVDKKKLCIAIAIAFGITALGAGIGVLIWYLTGMKDGTLTDYLVPAVMVGGTVLGLVGSMNKKLRSVKGTSKAGHYLILVFSLALAMSMDFENFGMSYVYILLFFSCITVLTFIVHVILCKIFKIDVDCAMVTLTAGLYGPAFVPAITRQVGDESLTPVGLLCGSFGYAIGTFFGAGVAMLLALI